MNGATNVFDDRSEPAANPIPRRWSALRACFTVGFRPATTAQRTQHLSLWHAYLVHVAAALLTPLLIIAAVVLGVVASGLTLSSALNEAYNEFTKHPYTVAFSAFGFVCLFEVAFAALALFTMAWGAKDEPLRESYRNAIRQVWLHTAHLIPIILLVSAAAVPLSRLGNAWNASYSIPQPEWPQPPENTPAGSPAWTQYNTELQAFWPRLIAWQQERREAQPWHIRHTDGLIAYVVIALVVWFVWASLRAIGAPRPISPVSRPPQCEACGYNLMTIAMESRCPECAELVVASLGPEARPGPIRSHRHEVGGLWAWISCLFDPIFRPTQFGRQCRITTAGTYHRLFFVLPFPAIFLIAAGSVLLGYYVSNEGQNPFVHEPEVGFIVAPVCGYVCCMGTLGVSLLAATLIGLFRSISEKRNLLPGSMQITSYLIGYLVLWAAVGATVVVRISSWIVESDIRPNDPILGFPAIVALPWLWILLNVGLGIWYLVLVSRGTAGTRYANK